MSKPIPLKTTEVRLNLGEPDELVGRAQQIEPALVMLEGDLPGQVFRLPPGRQVVGRRPECDIRLRERAVSGIHAEVIREGETITVTDLASTNGTYVNGTRIEKPAPLKPGTLLKIGNCVFKYMDSRLEVEFTEALHVRGVIDQLTGANNRNYLVSRLGFVLDTASDERPVSLIAFDFDNFKVVNDRHGHAAGDHILRAVSALIMESFVRESDLFARIGGEEFVIVLPETRVSAAVEIAEKIRRRLEEEVFVHEKTPLGVTGSFGVCSSTTAGEAPEVVLARADELLYRSKREGRNRVSAE
jgi:diguanylate cyclase (GGDEF)-like protein